MSFAKVPEGITTKDEYDTCLGKLKFQDGLPDEWLVGSLVYSLTSHIFFSSVRQFDSFFALGVATEADGSEGL